MPRSADPKVTNGLPITHSPSRRLEFTTRKPNADAGDVAAAVRAWWQSIGLGSLRDETGIDLSNHQGIIQTLLAPFRRLWNPLAGNEEQGNLFAAADFVTAVSLSAGNGWSWDGTQGRTGLGAAMFTASGVPGGILSNQVAVAGGQRFDISVWLKWSGVTATGTAFSLNVYLYDRDGNYLRTDTLASFTSPATNQTAWLELSDIYLVPSTVTVNGVAVPVALLAGQLYVSPTVTAGSVWWDDAAAYKTTLLQLFQQRVVDRLNQAFRGILDDVEGYDTDQLYDATAANVAAATGTTAQMLQILAALGNGTPDADDFERLNPLNLGGNWSIYQTGGGILSTGNAHDASWNANGAAEFVAYKNNVVALTDNQTVSVALSSEPDARASFGLYGSNACCLRLTSFSSWATRTGLWCYFAADKTVQVWWYLNGVGTQLFTTEILPVIPSANSTLEFSAGVLGNPLRMVAKLNNAPVLDQVDTVSTYGSTQRRRGFGGVVKHALIIGDAGPGRFKQWTAQG